MVLANFTDGNQILDIQKVPVVLISTVVAGLGFYFVLRHCKAEKDFLLPGSGCGREPFFPSLVSVQPPPGSMYSCACFRDC